MNQLSASGRRHIAPLEKRFVSGFDSAVCLINGDGLNLTNRFASNRRAAFERSTLELVSAYTEFFQQPGCFFTNTAQQAPSNLYQVSVSGDPIPRASAHVMAQP